jgi:patatin-like phospholipase/acyl hydrolase
METLEVLLTNLTSQYRLDNADSPTSSTESRNLLQTSCIKLIQQQALASLQDTGKRENFGVAYSDVLRNLAANRYYALKIDAEFFKSTTLLCQLTNRSF